MTAVSDRPARVFKYGPGPHSIGDYAPLALQARDLSLAECRLLKGIVTNFGAILSSREGRFVPSLTGRALAHGQDCEESSRQIAGAPARGNSQPLTSELCLMGIELDAYVASLSRFTVAISSTSALAQAQLTY